MGYKMRLSHVKCQTLVLYILNLTKGCPTYCTALNIVNDKRPFTD